MNDYNPFSLGGKTLLVTGASSGIGRATAIAASKLGARIILTARNRERLEATLGLLGGENHNLIVADLTNDADLIGLVEKCPELDGLVLAAGTPMMMPYKLNTRKVYEEAFSVNFFANNELLRQLLKAKKLRHGASAVFVSSVAGVSAHAVGLSAYGAAKAAVDSIVKSAAKELAPEGIRVNGVNPGMTDTPFIRNGALTDAQIAAQAKTYPLGRIADPEDIASGVVYLLSDAAAFITGQALVIDGGLSL